MRSVILLPLVMLVSNAVTTYGQDVQSVPSQSGVQEFKIENGEVFHRIPGSQWGNEFRPVNGACQRPLHNILSVVAIADKHEKFDFMIAGFYVGVSKGDTHFLALDNTGNLWHSLREDSGAWRGWGDASAMVNVRRVKTIEAVAAPLTNAPATAHRELTTRPSEVAASFCPSGPTVKHSMLTTTTKLRRRDLDETCT